MRVFLYELKKIFIKQYGLIIMLLIIAAAVFSLPESMVQSYGFDTSDQRARYLDMIKPLTGTLTQENEKVIISEYERLLEGRSAEEDIFARFKQGEINDEQLQNQLAPYKDVLDNEAVITSVFEKYQYVAEDRENRMLLPTSHVPVMEQDGVNYFFLLGVAFCGAFAIMTELTGKKDMILKTTPNGQQKTTLSKLAVMAVFILTTSAVLTVIDLIKLSAQLPAEYWGFSLCSLERYSATEYKISIIGAFAVVQTLRPIGYMLICVLAMMTAHFSKNYVAAVFPYAALPIAADYLAELDSQAYFLPTGLLKGYGYFFGNIVEDNWRFDGDPPTVFHGISPGYFTGIIIFSAIVIVICGAILTLSGKNRLIKKKVTGIAVLPFIALLLTSCGSTEQIYTEYGGYSRYADQEEICENSRYIFTNEYADEQSESAASKLYITDKQTGSKENIPFPCFEEEPMISDMCATEDNLYILDFSSDEILRLRLADMSFETVYSNRRETTKSALGLTVDYDDNEPELHINDLFVTNGRLHIFADGKIFAMTSFKNFECVIDESTEEYQYDSSHIFYVNSDRELKVYDTAKRTVCRPTEKHIGIGTLKSDAENIYYSSGNEDYVMSKSDLKESAAAALSAED